ncbi:MAG TPA: xanthine dehydrogenase family protein molybdopterin-binding subunit [Myxococcota bacterium]|nr:xanthine dehydrogenase family protein molybdopterin-binding subunit [Myxococcota bacterium]HRY93264.1 xanthine dehydrogenase family protein molybdopterin-binding subunit [Myxococcota bacterium]HSA19954.1 xanthine dehydrogenase family protein molybdopterin-binding subunit [Myxococcota bacterium]
MKKPFTPRVRRKHVGGYRPRIDGAEKAAGKARYIDDLTTPLHIPGLAYAKVLRSPYPRARIRRLDTRKAAALPGVLGVLTYQDPEVAALKPTSAGWTDGVDTVSYDKMMWGAFRDRRVLGDYACWAGDEVGAVVAAESEQLAEQALRLLEVDWEKLPFVLEPEEAMRPGAPVLHPEIAPTNVLPADPVGGPDVFVVKGDAEAELARAEVVVEGSCAHHNATQCSLDPWCCVVEWTDALLTVWSNAYEADQTRTHLSEMLGLPLHKVRVVSPYVGGQFGRGDTGDQPFFLFTALLARKVGRPVKFKHTRRESFHDGRQPAVFHARVGARRDGTITAMTFESLGNAGAHADHTMFALKFAPLEVAEVAFAHIPHIRIGSRAVYTDKMPACMMRGVGNSQFNLSLGHMLDLLAERLGVDPVELALKNFGHEWEGLPNRSLTAVLRAGAERLGWREKRHAPGQGPAFEGTKKRGVGFSFHPAWHAEWQEVRRGEVQVALTLNPDCTVNLDAASVETGTGSNTCNVLGCAEALACLGIGPADIRWEPVVDTQVNVKDCVQTDSAVAFLQSEVLAVAAGELRQRLCERAAPALGRPAAELEVVDGRVRVRAEPARGVAVRELLRRAPLTPIRVHSSRPPLAEKTGVPFIATFAEVEVDTATGRTQVLRLVVVNDCGTVMYASGAEAQQIGGQCMGMGEALTEEIIYDRATGVPLNFNWIDYKIPTLADMPDIEPVLLEVWRGGGEYGACGIGEGTVTCAPRAILNAIHNAIGKRLDAIPVKPEKVLAALGKA